MKKNIFIILGLLIACLILYFTLTFFCYLHRVKYNNANDLSKLLNMNLVDLDITDFTYSDASCKEYDATHIYLYASISNSTDLSKFTNKALGLIPPGIVDDFNKKGIEISNFMHLGLFYNEIELIRPYAMKGPIAPFEIHVFQINKKKLLIYSAIPSKLKFNVDGITRQK